jgi:hypothetical protein
MTDVEKLQAGMLGMAGMLIIGAILLGWLAFAEHPTAGSFRRAAIMSLKAL